MKLLKELIKFILLCAGVSIIVLSVLSLINDYEEKQTPWQRVKVQVESKIKVGKWHTYNPFFEQLVKVQYNGPLVKLYFEDGTEILIKDDEYIVTLIRPNEKVKMILGEE